MYVTFRKGARSRVGLVMPILWVSTDGAGLWLFGDSAMPRGRDRRSTSCRDHCLLCKIVTHSVGIFLKLKWTRI